MVTPSNLRHTRTYVVMQVSDAVFEEIKILLLEAGYGHAIGDTEEFGEILDMHGIGIGKRNPS